MPKKPNFDNAIKKAENISNKIDIIMRNRLIIAFFLIVDGITFLLNPDTTLAGMAQNIILIIIFASFSVLIANLASKTKDIKTILISITIIIVSIIFYIYPDIIAAYMQLLLSLFIIYDSVSNIASTLHLQGKLVKYTNFVTQKYNKWVHRKAASKEKASRREKFKEVDDNINAGLEEQANKLITPLKNLEKKSSKSSTLYIIVNITSIILGLVLLFYPGASMMVWGIIFLYAGFYNSIISIRTMNLSKKIKEKKFKEILYDTEKDNKK